MSATERLAVWRNLRQTYNDPAVNTLLAAFASIKPEPRFLDYYTPSSWPSVFEIVADGMFCQTGITLVLTATMANLGFIKTETVTLDVISNHITGREGLVLLHNNLYYNFLPGDEVPEMYGADNSTRFDRHVVQLSHLLK